MCANSNRNVYFRWPTMAMHSFSSKTIWFSLVVHGEVQSVVQHVILSCSEVIFSVWCQQWGNFLCVMAAAPTSPCFTQSRGGVKPSLHSTALSKGLLFKRFLNAGENYSLINSVLYWIQFTPYYWIEMHHEFISNNNLANAFYQSMLQYSVDKRLYMLPL